MRTYTMRCDICGEVTTLPANEQRPEGWGTFIYRSPTQGDIVTDIFGGSGTTMIACEQLDRRCYMMELDPHYCDVIINRWETYTGRKAEKVVG